MLKQQSAWEQRFLSLKVSKYRRKRSCLLDRIGAVVLLRDEVGLLGCEIRGK